MMSCEEKDQLSNALYENIELRFKDLQISYENVLCDAILFITKGDRKPEDVDRFKEEKKKLDRKRMDFFLSLKTIQDSFKFTPRTHTWLHKAIVEYKECFTDKIAKENEMIQSNIIENMKLN